MSDAQSTAIVGGAGRHRGDLVPDVYRRAPDPFVALRYQFDVQRMFVGSAATIDGASAPAAASKSKKLSLRRPKKPRPTEHGDENDPAGTTSVVVRVDQQHAKLVTKEVERIVERLSQAADAFVELARRLCMLSDHVCSNLALIAPLVSAD